MPETSFLVKAVMVGFIALMVLCIAAYHVILDPRQPRGSTEKAAPSEEAKVRAA